MGVARPRRAAAAIAVLCLSLLAVGCDGDAGAEQTPSPAPPPASTPASAPPTSATPPATPTTPPKPAPPVIPAAATKGLTVTSAEAFARFYLKALDYATATGDSSVLRRWAYRSCTSCKSVADGFESTYAEGGGVTGDTTYEVLQVTEARLIRKDTAEVKLSTSQGQSVYRATAKGAPTTFPAHKVQWNFALAVTNGHWTMFEMVRK